MEQERERKRKLQTVDVVIPVYRPGKKFGRLLRMLARQTYPAGKVIVVNTEERYWDKERFSKWGKGLKLEVHHIRKQEFDHGGTRRQAVSYSQADVFVCLTDDAVPANPHLLQRLMEGFGQRGPKGELPAMVYARQLADKDCKIGERYARHFNYPPKSRVKTAADLPKLGIKTYFGSNVCCAYDREIYDHLGGFGYPAIFNEDMVFAGRAVQAGYGVVYQAEAKVVHSHNFSCLQQFRRNFDLAVSQADHPEVFGGLPSEGEGIRLVKKTAAYLARSGHLLQLPDLVVKSGFKYLGYRLGKAYWHLPKRAVLWCTMNRNYWSIGEGGSMEGLKALWERQGIKDDDNDASDSADFGIRGNHDADYAQNPQGKAAD